MKEETLISVVNYAFYFVTAVLAVGTIGIIYFIINFKSIQKQALAERERILQKQQQNRDDSGKRFESYRKHLDEFKNKPIL